MYSTILLWTGPGTAKSPESQSGCSRLCQSLPQLHVWLHLQQLSRAVQSPISSNWRHG